MLSYVCIPDMELPIDILHDWLPKIARTNIAGDLVPDKILLTFRE